MTEKESLEYEADLKMAAAAYYGDSELMAKIYADYEREELEATDPLSLCRHLRRHPLFMLKIVAHRMLKRLHWTETEKKKEILKYGDLSTNASGEYDICVHYDMQEARK